MSCDSLGYIPENSFANLSMFLFLAIPPPLLNLLYLCFCLSVCLSLSIYLSISLSLYLYIYIPNRCTYCSIFQSSPFVFIENTARLEVVRITGNTFYTVPKLQFSKETSEPVLYKITLNDIETEVPENVCNNCYL